MDTLEKTINNLNKYCKSEYFSDEIRGYSTPNQIRDNVMETVYSEITNLIHVARKLAQDEDLRRKNSPNYIKCNRCFGFHSQKENIDGLCEKREALTAPFRFDEKSKIK